MGDKNRGAVEMKLQDGSIINRWTSFTLRDTYTDPLGSYDFEFRPERGSILDYGKRVRKGNLIGVIVGGITIGAFIVQTVTRNIGRDGVTFRVHCESVLATPYQACVDPDIAKHYQTDTPVTTVVLEALAPFGFTTIEGDTAASRAAISGKAIGGARAAIDVEALKHQDAKAQEGETAYGFCSRIFNRMGVCLRVDRDGKLILGAPDYEQQPSYTLVQDFDGKTSGDRMLDGIEIEDSNDGIFSECVVRGSSPDKAGQTQASMPIARVGVKDGTVTGQEAFSSVKMTTDTFGGHAYRSDSAVAPYKPLHILDKNSRDAKQCESKAKRAMGMRNKNAFSVSCEVDGVFSGTGRLWAVDTVANVIVEAAGINERMWISEVQFTLDAGGQRTRLKLLPLGALVLGDIPS